MVKRGLSGLSEGNAEDGAGEGEGVEGGAEQEVDREHGGQDVVGSVVCEGEGFESCEVRECDEQQRADGGLHP